MTRVPIDLGLLLALAISLFLWGAAWTAIRDRQLASDCRIVGGVYDRAERACEMLTEPRTRT